MYLRILKKDLKRKKTMNLILLIFISLAAAFIASGAGNMLSVATALDRYFELAEAPDYWFATLDKNADERFEQFAYEHSFRFRCTELIQLEPKKIIVDGEAFDYSNTVCLSSLRDSNPVFDSGDRRLARIAPGEIYVTAEIFASGRNHFFEGAKIEISNGGASREFTLRGSIKDCFFGSPMTGITRFLVSEEDYAFFAGTTDNRLSFYSVYTDDIDYVSGFLLLMLDCIFNGDKAQMRQMYLMDVLTAAIILVVSLCLILISMVILQFIIRFTMSEEFREIGVMKAIGIPDYRIRLLYTVKYLAISALGAAVGLALSFPLGSLLLESASRNIILSNGKMIPVHLVCAFLTAALIVLFCWSCTRKIRSFSPIDAIRNGETGERYTGKGRFGLNRSRLAPPLFLAVNDISGGLRRYASMLAIFTIGILLVTIPSNTINTLSSDRLVTLFNMAECDHVITRETMLSFGGSNKAYLLSELEDIKNTLAENGIEAEVFQELVFRMNVSRGGLSFSSLAFQGIGGITADRYVYIDGTPPQNSGEIALSYLTAEHIGAKIGDDVRITVDRQTRTYLLTAINQSLNNSGEAVRFHPDAELDYGRVVGSFGIQIRYADRPDQKELDRRLKLLRSLYPDDDIRSAGEYINLMIGDVAGQLDGIRSLIFGIVLCINLLVTVLMVKSFVTKEKGEIALLRAIGFSSASLIAWQAMRIGLVLLLAALLGALLSTPLTRLTIEPIFRMMGAYSISFEIRVLEVYVVRPLIIFAAATAAAALSACQLKKIPASEVSNIE